MEATTPIKKSQAKLTTYEDSHTKFDELFDNGLKTSAAFLHQTLTSPGLPPERTLSQAKMPGSEMSWTPSGLLIKWKSKKGEPLRMTIPAANVATCTH